MIPIEPSSIGPVMIPIGTCAIGALVTSVDAVGTGGTVHGGVTPVNAVRTIQSGMSSVGTIRGRVSSVDTVGITVLSVHTVSSIGALTSKGK